MKGVKFGNFHSYDTWGLLRTAKEIGSPSVKEKKIDIEGADGDLDYTEVFGSVKYGNRTLKFEFQKAMKPSELVSLASDIQDAIHGQKMAVTLDDDPDWYYHGRVSVKDFSWKKGIGTISIEVDAEPYKLKKEKTRHIAVLSGKNIIDKDSLEGVSTSGASSSVIGTGIRVTIVVGGQYQFAVFKIAPIATLLGQKVTVSFNAKASAANQVQVILGYAAEAYRNVLAVERGGTSPVSMVIKEEYAEQYKDVVLFLYGNLAGTGNVGDYVDYTNLQVEIGNATSYEAYNGAAKSLTINAVNSRMITVPTIHTSQSVVVEKDGVSVTVDGSQVVESLLLEQGSNTFSITGKGIAAIEYQEGRL